MLVLVRRRSCLVVGGVLFAEADVIEVPEAAWLFPVAVEPLTAASRYLPGAPEKALVRLP